MRARFAPALAMLFCLGAAPALAEGERTILVLDGSGSMWGQIEGKNKIVIAREVVGDLLEDLPADLELGLTVYGHRRKGDCADIESVVAPGTDSREAIRSAVNAINPKGKTPLSDAVVAAAESLKYTEDKATVILVSDGRETCNADPCEIGRKLEESGVDFTAHVIGFDVSEEKDKAQLRCLAENTGGEFLSASTATELTEALKRVSAPPPPTTLDVTFRAVEDSETGPQITEDLIWTVTAVEIGEAALENASEAAPLLELDMRTRYRAEVLRTTDEMTAEAEFTTGSADSQTVILVLETPLPDATLTAPGTGTIGLPVEVEWTGPDTKNDYIGVSAPDSSRGAYEQNTYTKQGSPLSLTMPSQPGEYEIRYVMAKGNTVLATRSITVEDAEVTLAAPDTAAIGDEIAVEWVGPDAKHDYIDIAKPESQGGYHESYVYTTKGSPLTLTMPGNPGAYEIRYVLGQKRRILATRPITVEDTAATLAAPETAEIGSTIKIDWTGPDAKHDYVAIARPEDESNRYESYVYTTKGSPAPLRMPAIAGDYELRYVLGQKKRILATRPITIEEAQVSVTAPETATVSATIAVDWEGPDAQNDYIAVAKPDAEGNKYENYAYTRSGAPVKLLMPAEPGEYEIRYVLGQKKRILATRPVTIEAAEVSVSAPESAPIGSTIAVDWVGPDAQGDYVSVAAPDQEDGKYVNYAYTKVGSPLKLLMPSEPGDYEIRYVLRQNRTAMARQPITVEEAEVSVSAPESAEMGTSIAVDWTGPDAQGDYIAIASPDAEDNKYVNYVYTRAGAPSKLLMPAEPGDYEIRYVLRQDRRILARQPITVEPATVTLDAKDKVEGGKNLSVDWVGPDGQGDYIAIALPNEPAKEYQTYKYTNAGSPLIIVAPKPPGEYELRYILRQNNSILARKPLTVEPAQE